MVVGDVGLSFFQLFVQGVVGYVQFELLVMFEIVEEFVGDRGVFLQICVAFGDRVNQSRTQMLEGRAFDDAKFFVEVLADLVQLLLFDGQGAAVVLDVVMSEDLYIDDGILGVGRHAQGGVLHIGRFLIEDRTQQFLFRSQLGFVFRSDFIDQDVVRIDFGIDIDDIGFVQFVQSSLTHVRDVRGDFFRAELGVTRYIGQLVVS